MKKRLLPILLVLLAVLFIVPIQGNATETSPAKAVSFYRHNQTGYVGLSDILSIFFSPNGTEEAYTMTSSDESVVKLEWSVFEHYTAYYLKPGSAVITVTTESGLTDQCTITVVEMESFELDESKTVTIQPEDVLTFEFEYEDHGDYVFFSTNGVDTWLKSETKDANIYYDLNRHYFTLDENSEFCRVSIYNDTSEPQTYTVKLMKAVPVEGITLHVSKAAPYYVGDRIWIKAELHPENAKQENLTWESSDTAILVLDRWIWTEYSADCLSIGNATVTVTSESGAATAIVIPVIEPGVLNSGHTFDIDLVPDERTVYSFTPEVTGEYVFCISEDYLIDPVGKHILFELSFTATDLSDNSSIAEVYHFRAGNNVHYSFFNFEAGHTYAISISCHSYYGSDFNGSIYFGESSPATSISFDLEDRPYTTGSRIFINAIFDPIFATVDNIQWESSDEEVVEIIETYYYDSAYIRCVAPGTAIITATTDSGLTASCEITVLEYQDYIVVSGDRAQWVQKSDTHLAFEINAAPEKFVSLRIDRSNNYIDPSQYIVTNGSADSSSLIMLSPSILDALSLGTHYAIVDYYDGSAVCEFTVVEKTSVTPPFTDVPSDSFYYNPVMWAIEKGITNGLSATEFGPTATCNRAQVVTFLWRAAGSPEPTSTVNPFVDVQAGSFYEKPVLWAVEKGITNGSDATHFGPNGVCNRAQVVTFLYRAFGSPAVSTEGLPFTDVPAGSWYEAPIAWAVENGVTNGLSATEFGPNASCNRAQVVTFLYRAYND